MKLYEITCTFSQFGNKAEFYSLNPTKENIVFEVDEYIGTDEEFHSGVFTENISVNKGETLEDVVRNYFRIHNSDLLGECFSIKDLSSGEKVMTEIDINI